jgi:hypothetical protein
MAPAKAGSELADLAFYAGEAKDVLSAYYGNDAGKAETNPDNVWIGPIMSNTVRVEIRSESTAAVKSGDAGPQVTPEKLRPQSRMESPKPRLIQVTVYYIDSKGDDQEFAFSKEELAAFSKLYPTAPKYRSDQGVKCADAVGLRFKFSDDSLVDAHFCGKPTRLHVFRPGQKGEMLTVPKDLYALLLTAARANGWQGGAHGGSGPDLRRDTIERGGIDDEQNPLRVVCVGD